MLFKILANKKFNKLLTRILKENKYKNLVFGIYKQ